MKKSILITGCSSGIGYTCAHALHQLGYQVIASCRHSDDVKQLQHEGLTCIQLDLRDSDNIDHAIKKTLEITDGKLDALFNNGAYGQPGALEDLPTQALREQFETNFFGWHHLVKQILPVMRKQGHGRIIQNSSILGFAAMTYRGAYNASKFALEGWTDTLRLELANSNIQISLIEPGPIETQFRKNAQKAFVKWINTQSSVHNKYYEKRLDELGNDSSSNRFVLAPESCVPPLLHALEAERPKIRYRVTTPTKVFAILKRLLSSRVLDRMLLRAS